MPCDTVILNRVDMPKMDPALRKLALAALGATHINQDGTQFVLKGERYAFADGRLVGRDVSIADRLKRAYSAEVVKYTARRAGWGLKQVGEFHYQMVKR